MPSITSNTLVKNGMPFIRNILEQVEPYMDEMVITLSESSDRRTVDKVLDFTRHCPKVILLWETTKAKSELTNERNRQVRHSSGDWILFLDDDDYWTRDQLELCLEELDKDSDMLAYSVNPYQLINFKYYDISWQDKSFSKFLRRDKLRFHKPWPKDIPIDENNSSLHWKTHPKVQQLPYRFYHLSYLKEKSFRNQEGFEKYKDNIGNKRELDKPFKL